METRAGPAAARLLIQGTPGSRAMVPGMKQGRTAKWSLGLVVPLQDPTPFSPFEPEEWPTALRKVAEAECSSVELAVTDPARLNVQDVTEALARSGLRVSSLATGQAATLEGLSLSSPDDVVRRKSVERVQAHMRLATSLHALVIVGLLRGSAGDLNLLVESLRECARSAPSVDLALEPLNRYESQLLNTVNETLAMLERVGAENIGVLFDTFHANIEERHIQRAIESAGDRLFHVHVADSNRWPPGHGHLNFALVWEALEETGYRRDVILECFPKPNAQAVFVASQRLRSQWSCLA